MRARTLPRLVAISDLSQLASPVLVERLERLAHAASIGSVALLLRDHQASARERLELGRALHRIARSSGQELWVADRLDLALLLEADGVHLGEASVTASQARQLVGVERRVTRACHAPGLADAELAGVDALLVSPVLAPRKGREPLGLATLAAWGEQLRARNPACPCYALGGISAANAAACLAAGAVGVAAIGAALAEDAGALLTALSIRR